MLVRTEAFRTALFGIEPVAFGTFAKNVQTDVSGLWQWTHDLDPLDDFMLVFVGYQSSDAAIDDITYDSEPSTLTDEFAQVNRRSQAGWLPFADLPSSGPNKDVEVDFIGTRRGLSVAFPLRGAKQAAPTVNGNAVDSTSIGSNVTVAPGGAVIQFLIVQGDKEASLQEGSGETSLIMETHSLATVDSTWLLSYKLDQSGEVSMSASWTGTARCAQIVIGIDPV